MIPTEQYIYLNTLAPNSDNIPQHAVFVAIRHACSLYHSHYPTLERLFRHMEAHFRVETQDGHDDEIDELDLTFQFSDDHPYNGMINEEGFHADNEDENSLQQDTGHPTSGVDSQNSVDDDRNEESAVNDQQELNSQDMGGEEKVSINNLILNSDDRDIILGLFIDA
ncbi:uncharacterized protein ATC70_009644 [Mucor velutinosus]|uniref:Uncharacterized protein n=1 Tax=Mucor velutinosus TaxID=708070 RepID=A0AAN7HPI5_9FUNG|nr:hypothetical protein ATC70_009644 [Mucor velutinosus]